MFKAEFTKMLREYPKCLEDKKIFSAYMKDLFPDEKLLTHILTSLFETGIIEDIKNADILDAAFSFRYTENLVGNYGYSQKNAGNAVYIWCYCYGKEVLGKTCSLEPLKPEGNKAEKKGKLYQDLFHYRINAGRTIVTGCEDKTAKTLVVPSRIDNTAMQAIDEYAFHKNNSLEQVVLTEGYAEIGKAAFESCSKLKQAIFPYGINNIGDEAFYGCISLDTLIIPESTVSIGDYAFSETAIKEVRFPNSVMVLGKGVLKDCRKLKKAVLNDNQREITDEMFSGCESLTKINLPQNITSIGSKAFMECKKLTEITIPDNVKNINEDAFLDTSEDLIIICSMGSAAEEFARHKHMKYQLM